VREVEETGVSVLALDLGCTVGWARSDGRNGSWAPEYNGDHGMAACQFSDWIEAMLDEVPLMTVAIERPVLRTVAAPAARLTLGFEFVTHMRANARDIPRTERNADTVRRWLVGFARVGKAAEPSKTARSRLLDKAVLAAVQARGFLPTDEHAADAIALLCMIEQRSIRQVAA
jgi:hypothetical protein